MPDTATEPASSRAGGTGATRRSTPLLEEIEPGVYRDQVLALFQANGKPDFRATFDWHYSADGCPSQCWCLKDPVSAELVGFVGVLERRFRCGSATLRAGVAADLLIAKSARSLGAAVTLIRATQSLVEAGDLDLLLARGNDLANRLIERLGYRPIGRWHAHHHFLRSRAKLRQSLGLAGVLASPGVDLWSWAMRARDRPPAPLH